ncbi:MAG: hypothetical protein SPI25_05130 [Dialister sp.]|nr:hypothetical protein [Dialister sp.]
MGDGQGIKGALVRYMLPGIILQSVLIGGGYATGREIVEYGAKFGAMGWLSGLATFAGFALVSVLSFELVRLYKVYDFKSFLKELIGPLYRIFDLVYLLFMVIIIAVMASATGAVVEQMLGFNYWYGVTAITIIVGGLNFYGEKMIAYFETFGTILLYVGYICFSVLVISHGEGNIARVFATADVSYVPDASIGAALWTGVLYMAYNLVVFPASFFTVRMQTRRRHSVISGIIAGLLMVIPWFLTYYAVMAFYPDKEILSSPVPWVAMMQADNAPGWLLLLFSIVMGWTLIETATGIIHAMLTRIDTGLTDSGKEPLTRGRRALLTLTILIASVIFAKVGIIDLIAKGYNMLAYAFILLYLLPLLTVGTWKILKKS